MPQESHNVTRRDLLVALVGGGAALVVLAVAFGWNWLKKLLPAREEPLPEFAFRAGAIADFSQPGVYTQHQAEYGVWIVHQADGTLVALQTVCTHLGCTPDWVPKAERFICPCHGSQYDVWGINVVGPTERPLERFAMLRRGAEVFVDKGRTYRQELGQWSSPDSFIDHRESRDDPP
jgi:cytochrome b6-f complex iron-sulfur subunit